MKTIHPLTRVLAVGLFVAAACSQKQQAEPQAASPAAAPAEQAMLEQEPGTEPPAEQAAEPTTPTPEASGVPPAEASAESAAPQAPPTEPAAPQSTSKAPASAASDKAAATGYSGDEPCKRSSFATAAVKDACQRGGRPQAKALMKSIVQKAKAAGQEVKCTSCHTDMKTFGLKDNAVDDLKKWL